MTPEEMRSSSAGKVKQIMDLMHGLKVRVEARQRISQEGFIEQIVFWIDDEQYPQPGVTGETAPTGESASTGETGAASDTGATAETAPTGETAA